MEEPTPRTTEELAQNVEDPTPRTAEESAQNMEDPTPRTTEEPLHVWLWEKERKFTEEEEEELLKISYLRPSPVRRNLSRDDNDDAKSLPAHWQRPMVALGKNWIRRKNLQGVSCKQAAQQATQRRHVRSLYCVVPNPPHTCTPHNKALCPSHSARHSIIFILWFDRCCNPFAASCKDIAIRHRRRGCNIAKHIGIRHRRKPYRAAGRQRLWNCGSTSKELLTMEYQSNVQYASCFPPRLEDAGLEDCALPLEKIQEAFRLAAEKMHTAAESVVEVLGVQGIKENDDGICVPDTKGANGQWGDSLVDDSDGIRGLVDSCVDTHTGGILEEGKDAVVDSGIEGKEDKLVGGIGDVGPKLGEGGCIAGDLGGLGGVPGVISTPERKTHDDDDDEPKGPTLAGVTL